MELKKACMCGLYLVLLLLASNDLTPGVQARSPRLCTKASRGFKGLCFADTNCAQVCMTEGYTGGNCHGLRRRCICQKPC
ncbi:hypothetical protein LUZ60_008999 [Juncus effusus]|nr:hypothetical protein LUZ60_008999 [Juncus effusus]